MGAEAPVAQVPRGGGQKGVFPEGQVERRERRFLAGFGSDGKTRFGTCAAALLLALTGCGGDSPSGTPSSPATGEQVDPAAGRLGSPAPFVDATAASGLDFTHFNGMSGELYYSEMMGSGVALFDYDNDGDLDVYLVQGGMLGAGKQLANATFPPAPGMLPLRDRLYRNDLTLRASGATGQPRFTDVTEASGLRAEGYGMGVATGDFDNDGWTDLYLTQAGANQLWRNLGDGTFADVTAAAGADDPRWSLSAAVVDFDRDGWLDLYVVNYLDFTVEEHRPCRMLSGQPDYCGPQAFEPLADRLLRNLGAAGNGLRFEDVSAAASIAAVPGAGMGVAAGDFDGDRRPDLFVANDGMANFLWLQRDDGVFSDEALISGTAFNREGQPEAGMGVDAGDFDRDGDDDLLITHLALETHTLYRNDGGGAFEDVTVASGLGAPSFQATGFGAALFDYDNDGWLDLLAVNGAVVRIPEQVTAGQPHPLGMSNQLFRSAGAAGGTVRFEEVAAGEPFEQVAVSRGLAVGDVDNDGDADAVVTHNAGPAQLLLNQVGQDRHWLGLRLIGGTTPRDMVGAEVEVARPAGSGPRLWRRVTTAGSYLSARDPRVLFGLGDDPAIGEVTVRWPDGSVERFDVEADRYTTLRQGIGRQGTDED